MTESKDRYHVNLCLNAMKEYIGRYKDGNVKDSYTYDRFKNIIKYIEDDRIGRKNGD